MSSKARAQVRKQIGGQPAPERQRARAAEAAGPVFPGQPALPISAHLAPDEHPFALIARDPELPHDARFAPKVAHPVAPMRIHVPTPHAMLVALARVARTRTALTAALAVAATVALQLTVSASITAFWVYLNFDADRGSLLSALVIALIAPCIGALPWRRRGVAVVATVAVFSLTGVRLFLAQVNAPPLPGVPAPPHFTGWALVHALVVLYSLATVCAALGAGLGAELGDWVVTPLWRARHEVVARVTASHVGPGISPALRRSVMGAAVVMLAAIICLASVGGASDLLFYGSQALVQTSQLPVETAPAPAQTQTSAQAQHGQLLRVTYPSAAFGGAQRGFDVYLPPDYSTPASAHLRYAVLYLLHGSPGNPDDIMQHLLRPQTLDTLITTGQIRPLIVVAPDGRSGAPVPTQWMNSTLGHFPVEDGFIREVIPYVDAHYRTLASPANRVVGGLSMGGYGAANLAVKHPDVLGGVIAMGAYFSPEGFARAANTPWFTTNSPALRLRTASTAPDVSFYLAAANEDHPYVEQTRAFARQLGSLRGKYTLKTWSGGHSWTVWQAEVVAGVRWFFGITTTHTGCSSCLNSLRSGQ